MKKICKIIYMVFMVVVSYFFIKKFINIETIDPDKIILGTNDLSMIMKTILTMLYIFAIICLPIIFSFIMGKKIWPIIYGIIIITGTLLSRGSFLNFFIGATMLPSIIMGAILDFFNDILRIFIPGYVGTWLIVVAQIFGHLLTIIILTSPEIMFEDSVKSKSVTQIRTSDTRGSSVLNHNFYEEARKEYQEQKKLDILKEIEKNLRN